MLARGGAAWHRQRGEHDKVTLWRWMLVVVLAVAGVGFGLVSIVALLSGLDRLCPPQQMVSGACIAPWYATAEVVVLALGAALGGAATVAWPAWAARGPARARVALWAWLGGAVYAMSFLFAVGLTALAPVLAALLGGGVVAWRVRR